MFYPSERVLEILHSEVIIKSVICMGRFSSTASILHHNSIAELIDLLNRNSILPLASGVFSGTQYIPVCKFDMMFQDPWQLLAPKKNGDQFLLLFSHFVFVYGKVGGVLKTTRSSLSASCRLWSLNMYTDRANSFLVFYHRLIAH